MNAVHKCQKLRVSYKHYVVIRNKPNCYEFNFSLTKICHSVAEHPQIRNSYKEKVPRAGEIKLIRETL